MRSLLIAPVLAAAGLLTAAAAQPGSSPLSPAVQDICLDVGGQTLPVYCQAPASRIDQRYDICICPMGRRVQAPVCAPDERPQPETRAFENARRAAAKDGSLVGDLFEGRPMCVAPRQG